MGERFGDYEIEGRLGAGGMAEVYVARRAGPEGFVKRVCLKRVLADSENDRAAVAQFHDEARLCAHLHHPAIAAVHELGQVDGKWFMSMELVDGMDLRSLVVSLRARGATLPADVAIHVARTVAEALAYAHALTIDGRPVGLVHRDVTPSNVLLSIHGEVKLADFGIARSEVRTHRTRTGIVKGKVPYMAPEQALGEGLDGRADVFALGVVLFELLAGRRPHDGQNDLETLTNAQRARRPSLRELAPEAPSEVVALVARMLAARHEDRPRSAEDVVRVLAEVRATRDPRTALAGLVNDARKARAGAPVTRIRGQRAVARVDAPIAAFDEGPTEIGGAPALDEKPSEPHSESLVLRRPAPNRPLQFALGFAGAVGIGAIALASVAVALGSDRIASVLAPPAERAIPLAPRAVDEPPKPASTSTSTSPSPSTSTSTSPSPAPSPSPSRRHASRPHEDAVPTATVAPTPSVGDIQVAAIPFGDVAVDGRPLGPAPLTTTVEAGEHLVSVRNGSAHVERHVSVAPGGTARFVADLLQML